MESMQAARNTWVTRCPNCQTAFRVSLKHLQAARGSVRCGSCLQVFKAPEHLASGELPDDILETLGTNTATKPEATIRQPDPEPEQAEDELIHDHANARDELEFNEEFLNLSPDDTGASGHDIDHHEDDEQPDESWARNILSELEKETGLLKDTPSKSSQSSDESHETTQPEQEKPTEKLQSLEDAPVALHYDARRQWKPILLWGSLTVAAIVTLAGQLLFFNFDTLARQDNWRPFFAATCNLLNCELPGKSDVSQIQTSHLVVRSTSDYENALSVDAIINNRASFSQPFPLIELTFTNDQGNVMASRQFAPEEYLAGELAGTTLIPPGQPVHLSLQIIDPGQEATNYQLFFYPNPSP
ncbi:DUF3426 domain-containing protein [Kistimonas asteriae]|uniref:DUF3426 domain-containing protein n=1 Tax=Kistimonas asteriae TaxID=517724 RepID=UPI001BA649F6|nr:DUF3426 domain-containing protein [Kistimonas asteriae]